MSEKVFRNECDLKVFRPFVVQLLMKRNKDLFKKYLIQKGAADTSKTEPRDNKDSPDYEKEANNTLSEISTQELRKDTKEFSIACQTDSENFFDQKKVLEKRINEEKRCQIKWIENEIRHLNILRELLEQQSSSIQRKKKHSFLTVTLNDDKSKENDPKYTPKEICPRTVTPVYGCTISISEKSNTASEENNVPAREQECQPQYGMTLSLSGKSKNWQRLVTLPVDLQLSLKDIDLINNGTNVEEKDIQQCSHREHSSRSDEPTISRQEQHHFDMCTQYPSPRRVSIKAPTSSRVEFPSPKKSSQCNQENCMCINISGNSSASVSRSSRSKSVDERNLAKSHSQNEEPDPEKRNRSKCAVNSEVLGEDYFQVFESDTKSRRKSRNDRLNSLESYKSKSPQNANCKCQSESNQRTSKIGSTSESSGSCSKHTPIQSTNSKCRSCLKHLPISHSKSLVTSSGVSQPNIQFEKTDDFHWSKIQLHKSSHCACHIIKIHGTGCCSSERNSCSCRSRNATKKTESQFCQTDCESGQQTEEVKLSKRDCGTSVSEEPSSDMRVAKEELHPKFAPNCSCRKKTDEHPRHYFLRVEETEVDELNKPVEPIKSLEVITVTVPVKKAGKGKIYDTEVRQTCDQYNPSPKLSSKECNCCGKNTVSYQMPPRDCERDFNSGYSKSRAEKPESPTRNPKILKTRENHLYEDFCSEEQRQKFFSSQQYYQERNSDGFGQGVTRPDEDEFNCCENCNCVHRKERENQKEYDSHRRRKSVKENYDDMTRFCEDRRELQKKMSQIYERQNEMVGTGGSSGLRNFRGQQFDGKADPGSSEYFNYNKREFMTKSEIKKEEEKKRKIHQPSLQEYLYSNRPDFYNSAERRREIISERSKERLKRKNSRMECLLKMLNQCNEKERCSKGEPKRIFTSLEMREQTLKRYKKLPEVTEKIADQKKKQEYRTNRLMADVFAKKLQIEALKGHLNLSNSVSVLNTV